MIRNRNRGFTLLEAMIAVVILSFGLLGIASIQILSLRSNVGSYGRSQATLAAYDIIDRMRANLPAVTGNNYLLDPAAPPADPGVDCIAAPCTVAQMAQVDLFTWLASLSALTGYDLISGTARITCSANPCVAGSVVTVSVMWDELRTGATGTDCPADSVDDRFCFQVSTGI